MPACIFWPGPYGARGSTRRRAFSFHVIQLSFLVSACYILKFMKTFITPVCSMSTQAEVHGNLPPFCVHLCGRLSRCFNMATQTCGWPPRKSCVDLAVKTRSGRGPWTGDPGLQSEGRSPPQQSWQPLSPDHQSSHVHSAQGLAARLCRCHNGHLGLLPRLLLEEQPRSRM